MNGRFLSLSSVKSEYRKLCDEGGPADIGVEMDKRHLEMYCNDYPSRVIVPVLTQFRNDKDLARRHWPWAACALGLYKYERSEREKYKE